MNDENNEQLNHKSYLDTQNMLFGYQFILPCNLVSIGQLVTELQHFFRQRRSRSQRRPPNTYWRLLHGQTFVGLVNKREITSNFPVKIQNRMNKAFSTAYEGLINLKTSEITPQQWKNTTKRDRESNRCKRYSIRQTTD